MIADHTLTYSEQLVYYSNLLAMQYRDKPRAAGTVRALADEIMAGNVAQYVRDAFNVDPALGDVAVGKQLDVLGKYVGVSRNVLTFQGGAVLNDGDYLTLIRLAIVRNNSTASLKDIDDLLLQYLGNTLIAYDNLNMSMSYFFNSSFGSSQLAQAFVKLGMLPRPAGVQIASLVYGGGLSGAFGLARYNLPAQLGSGMNRYATGELQGAQLRYTNTVNI